MTALLTFRDFNKLSGIDALRHLAEVADLSHGYHDIVDRVYRCAHTDLPLAVSILRNIALTKRSSRKGSDAVNKLVDMSLDFPEHRPLIFLVLQEAHYDETVHWVTHRYYDAELRGKIKIDSSMRRGIIDLLQSLNSRNAASYILSFAITLDDHFYAIDALKKMEPKHACSKIGHIGGKFFHTDLAQYALDALKTMPPIYAVSSIKDSYVVGRSDDDRATEVMAALGAMNHDVATAVIPALCQSTKNFSYAMNVLKKIASPAAARAAIIIGQKFERTYFDQSVQIAVAIDRDAAIPEIARYGRSDMSDVVKKAAVEAMLSIGVVPTAGHIETVCKDVSDISLKLTVIQAFFDARATLLKTGVNDVSHIDNGLRVMCLSALNPDNLFDRLPYSETIHKLSSAFGRADKIAIMGLDSGVSLRETFEGIVSNSRERADLLKKFKGFQIALKL